MHNRRILVFFAQTIAFFCISSLVFSAHDCIKDTIPSLFFIPLSGHYSISNSMKKIILITGGQRSGKSSFAEKKAHELTTSPVYLATAKIWDEEFRKRVERHQKNRGPEWTNIEEEKELSRHNVTGRVVVIDCVTLWCTNFFMEFDSDVTSSLEAVQKEFDKFTRQDATFIFVTNEIGLGGVSENELQRKFTDLQGWANQYIASQANDVYLMVSGIPVKIK